MPRAVDHARRRKLLVDALWRVVDRDGVEKATMREIATEAGVSIGMLQHYFADKDEIFALAIRSSRERYGERVRRLVAALGDDTSPGDVIVTAIRNRLPLTLRQRRHASVMLYWLRGTVSPSGRAALVDESERIFTDVLAEALTTAQARGELAEDLDLPATTDALVALGDGLILGLIFGRLDRRRALAALDAEVAVLFGGANLSNMAY